MLVCDKPLMDKMLSCVNILCWNHPEIATSEIIVSTYHAAWPHLFRPFNNILHDEIERVVGINKDEIQAPILHIPYRVHAVSPDKGHIVRSKSLLGFVEEHDRLRQAVKVAVPGVGIPSINAQKL